jgi:hypothetical protein
MPSLSSRGKGGGVGLEPIPINIFFLYLFLIHTVVGGNSVSVSRNDTDIYVKQVDFK